MFCHVLNFPCIGRFATEPYSTSDEDIDNMFIHLTNYSINKESELFEPNIDPENPQVSQELKICSSFAIGFQGSKWTLTSLWKYLYETSGIERQPIWDQGFQNHKFTISYSLNFQWKTLWSEVYYLQRIISKLSGKRCSNVFSMSFPQSFESQVNSHYNCYMLLGYDILLDNSLQAHLIGESWEVKSSF